MEQREVQLRINYGVDETLTGLEEHLAWGMGVELTEVRLTKVNGGWRYMCKVRQNKRALVSFERFDTFAEALEFLAYEGVSGTISFRLDKYP